MASSGTIADPIYHMRFRPPRGREEVFLAGYVQIKSQAVIEAGDLELRTIKTFQAMPFYPSVDGGGVTSLYGSINTPGSLMNSVTLNVLKGSQKVVVGTTHSGTIVGGSMQMSFQVIGA